MALSEHVRACSDTQILSRIGILGAGAWPSRVEALRQRICTLCAPQCENDRKIRNHALCSYRRIWILILFWINCEEDAMKNRGSWAVTSERAKNLRGQNSDSARLVPSHLELRHAFVPNGWANRSRFC